MKSVGSQLKEGRQGMGWTIKAAAKVTKIREDQLLKLESDDFAKFHASTYVRGFVRNYATVLGLNVRQITEDLDQVLEREGDTTSLRTTGINYVPELAKGRREFNPRSIFLGLAGLILIGFIGILGYEFYRVAYSLQLFEPDAATSAKILATAQTQKSADSDKGTKSDTSETVKKADGATVVAASPVEGQRVMRPDEVPPTAPVPPPTVAPVVSTVPENKLALAAKEECWVRVSVLENNQPKTIFEDVLSAGKTMEFPPASKYLLKLSIPAAVDISLNGKSYSTSHSDERLPVEFSVPAGDTN